MNEIPHLEVNTKALRAALKYLKRFTNKTHTMNVYWGYDTEGLMLQMGSTQAHADAVGNWQGMARSSYNLALAVLEGLPDTATVNMYVENGKLHVGGVSSICMWDDRQGPLAHTPLAGDLESLLALRLHNSSEELERSGMTNLVIEAERKRNNMVTRAVTALRPLGITRGEILGLIEERLKRKYHA